MTIYIILMNVDTGIYRGIELVDTWMMDFKSPLITGLYCT